MNHKLPKRIVGFSIGVAAWGWVTAAIPEWHFFSLQTIFITVAFTLGSISKAFFNAAKLNAWPWNTKLTVTGDDGCVPMPDRHVPPPITNNWSPS